MYKFAISGNIASGKSVVEDILKQKGFIVFDTDKLSHEILSDFKSEVIKAFEGFDITEGNNISRAKLGKIVFENKDLKKKLEDIIYPKLKEKILNIFNENQKEKYVFISIPLLFEVGWENLFDKILFIKTDENIRLKRLMARNQLTREEAELRLNSQKSQDLKAKKSDFIICNNDDIINLQKEVDEFIILLEDME